MQLVILNSDYSNAACSSKLWLLLVQLVILNSDYCNAACSSKLWLLLSVNAWFLILKYEYNNLESNLELESRLQFWNQTTSNKAAKLSQKNSYYWILVIFINIVLQNNL